MARRIVFVGIVMSIALSVGIAWAGPNMNPGKWEITTKTEMAGLPSQSMTHIQCVTNDDIVPMDKDASQECQVKDVNINGNTVTWKIICTGEGGSMEGTGQITYSGDSMQGNMQMTIPSFGTQMENTLSGKRIGNCAVQQ